VWTGRIWLRIEPAVGSSEHGNETSGSLKAWEFLDWLSGYKLLKKDSARWSWLVGWLVGWLVRNESKLYSQRT
jgi:hypothetical protein